MILNQQGEEADLVEGEKGYRIAEGICEQRALWYFLETVFRDVFIPVVATEFTYMTCAYIQSSTPPFTAFHIIHPSLYPHTHAPQRPPNHPDRPPARPPQPS